MKTKLLMVLFAVCACMTSYSQLGRPSLGIRAGVNFQNLNGKDAQGENLDNRLKVGFNAGVTADVPIAEDFYVQPGLLFSTKGARAAEDAVADDARINLSYLELPINLVYKPVLGQGNLIMGFGPYVAYALGGKVKTDNAEVDLEFENEVTPVEYAAQAGLIAKRFDAGANLLFGYEFNSRVSAQLNAQLGLLNLQPKVTGVDRDDVGTWKNTGFGVSLGYKF